MSHRLLWHDACHFRKLPEAKREFRDQLIISHQGSSGRAAPWNTASKTGLTFLDKSVLCQVGRGQVLGGARFARRARDWEASSNEQSTFCCRSPLFGGETGCSFRQDVRQAQRLAKPRDLLIAELA